MLSCPRLTAIEELDAPTGTAFRVEGVDGLNPRDLHPGDRVRIGDSVYVVRAVYGTRRVGMPFSVLVEDRVIVE